MTVGSPSPPASRIYYCYLLLGMVVVALGFNWPILDRAVEVVPPLWLMTFRLWGGALVGFGMNAAVGKRPAIVRQDWKIIPILGVFRLLAIFVFVFFALQILPPGRSGILVWSSLLWTVPLAVIFLGERMSRLQTGGLVVGLAGLGLVLEPWTVAFGEPRVILAYAMLLGAALSGAWTTVYIRAHRWGGSALASTPWQMLCGGIPALALALSIDGIPDIHWTWGTVLLVLYQMTLAGPLAVWGHLEALRDVPALSANLVLMATPVVALLSSWWLADERFSLAVVVGLALITSGVAAGILGNKGMRSVPSGLA